MGLGSFLRRKPRTAANGANGGWSTVGLPEGAGVLSVEISDPLGNPLPGADITLTDAANGRRVVKATTDPYGRVTAALPHGRYALMATVEGLQPVHRTIEVVAGVHPQPERVRMEAGQQPTLPQPGVWMFDPPHTAIRFVARHVGMANVHGRFTRFDGGIRVGERVEDSYIEITIDAASIDTGNKSRDEHLRSADFLDVERYPYLHFVSNRLTHRTGTKWTLQGTLTLHGVSRTLNLETTYLGAVNGGYAEELRCAALATAELHREDYTLNWRNMLARGIAIVGPTVKLELDIQAMYRNEGTPTPPE
ncbi:YceI family protein [Streptomyces iconiensis]|uniref:YceI family protein n=1 Tax=Streptomyces iconiensis TaxID=1384038 RepID=A0ABT7A8B5_9ACTN|nr:YceI family protein [Streptomyces iconiensis]MDJ1137573.1 YceI family protein [Streptomyces iconiensis]